MVLAGALAAFMLAIAVGTYSFVGHPGLAMRSLERPKPTDVRALVSTLAWRMRQSPNDPRGWALLGRGYLTLDDPADAAAAFERAVTLAPSEDKPALYSAYGEALTAEAMGAVTSDAEAAFRAALAGDPKNAAARFYLGQAYAQRRDTANALTLWKGLLADTPPTAPWRNALLVRIAMLENASPPNIAAMVQRLADRLKADPNNPSGWQRLVRAYVVLGESDKARAALTAARRASAGHAEELAALDAEARALKLEK
jgi:cytochrome c-type biogenesis protein CcmH